MWPAAVATDAFRAAVAGRGRAAPGDAAAVRDPRVGDRRDAAPRRGRPRPRGPGDHHLPAPRRGRGRHALLARRRRVYERFVETVRARHADTLFSDDGRTVDQQVADLLRARGLTIATAESCTGGLLAGAADRARRLVGLRARRARRLLQRGEGGAGGRRSGAHRARRGGLARGRRGAGRRRAGGAGRRRRRRDHGRRRAGRRDRASPSASCASAWRRADGAPDAQREPPRRPGRRARPLDHRRHAPRPAAAGGGRERPPRG